MYYVYVLLSSVDGHWYIGYTTDLKRRIAEHQRHSVRSTAYRKALKLVSYEAYVNPKDAQRRERYLKTSKGKNALRQMLSETRKEIA